ncbi:MAG: pyridoxamine 5'-phosphate oxidase [Halorhodospira sp.]
MSEPAPDTDILYREALGRVRAVLERAQEASLPEPTAGVLATAGVDGWPAARTVLLKQLDEAGAVFYTNRTSRKGSQLAENPRAALCFYFQPLYEQVEIRGVVVPVDPAEADAYWCQRERLSQLGAWASYQSQPLESREVLEVRLAEAEARFPDDIPRPPYWSGYRIVPASIELWSAGEGRLHERERYEHRAEGWCHFLLNP